MHSVQLTTYLAARASGATVELACEQSGIGLGEAELWEADIASGEVELPHVRARAPAREDQPKEEGAFMARDNENVRNAEQTVAADQLRLFIERIERLKDEIKGLNEDVSEVFKEAKGQGYDKWDDQAHHQAARSGAALSARKRDAARNYMNAIGMTPIEQAIAHGA
jgi:uncharacterized protein (UPF0335 family)